MDSYFGKRLSGGRDARAGMVYQDYCALICLFKYSQYSSFLSITSESLDDFTVINENKEILFQVKKKGISLGLLRDLLTRVKLKNCKSHVFIGTYIDERVEILQRRKNTLNNSLSTKRSPEETTQHKYDFINELRKNGLEDFYEEIMVSEFLVIPESSAETILEGAYSIFIDKNKLSINKRNMLNELITNFLKMGTNGGNLDMCTLSKLIEEHRIMSGDIRVHKENFEIVLDNLKYRLAAHQCALEEVFNSYCEYDVIDYRDQADVIFNNLHKLQEESNKNVIQFLDDLKKFSPKIYIACKNFLEREKLAARRVHIHTIMAEEPPHLIYAKEIMTLEKMLLDIEKQME